MIRLPKSVADAKAEFERANDIKDAVNNPRTILKDTPAEAIYEYQNPTIAALCQKKLAEYNALALVVRTKILGASPIALQVAQKAAEALGLYAKGLAKFPEVDEALAQGALGSADRHASSVPACLEESSQIADILGDIAKDFLSLFNGDSAFTSILDNIISSLNSNLKKARDALKGAFGDIASQVKSVAKVFEDAFKLVQNELQRALFVVFDAISNYIKASGLGQDLAKLREYFNCLRSHCSPALEYMVDMSDVMPNMYVDLPIDQYTGEFRVYKLYIYSDSYPDLNSTEGQKVLSEMDSDYVAYTQMRKSKIDELAKSLGSKIDVGRFL